MTDFENKSVAMLRESLDGLPVYHFPEGYIIRQYVPGDEKFWTQIHLAADRYNTFPSNRFCKEFGADPETLSARQFYLIAPDGEAAGTATAWFNDDYHGEYLGRVHWVAISPEYQGKGLAKPLMSAVCARLRDLGHKKAYLTTSTSRTAAINLYLKFGFVPGIRSREDEEIWARLTREIPGLTRFLSAGI